MLEFECMEIAAARGAPKQASDYCVGSRRTMRLCRDPMSVTKLNAPGWHLSCEGFEVELRLTGDWVACETGIRSVADVHHIVDDTDDTTLRLTPAALAIGTVPWSRS